MEQPSLVRFQSHLPAALYRRLCETVDRGDFVTLAEAVRHVIAAGLDALERRADPGRRGGGR